MPRNFKVICAQFVMKIKLIFYLILVVIYLCVKIVLKKGKKILNVKDVIEILFKLLI